MNQTTMDFLDLANEVGIDSAVATVDLDYIEDDELRALIDKAKVMQEEAEFAVNAVYRFINKVKEFDENSM